MNTKHRSLSGIIVLRKIIFTMLILCTGFLHHSIAQVFWNEPFGTGCNQGQLAINATPVNGAWTISSTGTNDVFANEWYISAAENGFPAGTCRDGCYITPGLSNQTLHVGNVPNSPNANVLCPTGDCGATYDPGGSPPFVVTTHKRIQSPVINCSGQNNITIRFNYFENGDSVSDNATLWYFDGITWTQVVDPPKTSTTNCSGIGFWTAFSYALPASANNNPNVKIGFLWENNADATGTNPSFAVDDIKLSSAAIPVTANFSVDSVNGGCAGSPRQFQDLSSGSPTGWFWVFSGGTPAFSTQQNPIVTYSFPGTYSVTLAAANASDTDTISRTNYITIVSCVSPVAEFVASSTAICQNHCINFTDLSQNTPTSWHWSFTNANPATSNVQNPTNICYADTGLKTVTLIVSNASGGDTITKVAYIRVNYCPPPVADFSFSDSTGCDTLCESFFDLSTNTPTEWHWYFPGAIPDFSTDQNPTNICYTSDGWYDVALAVSNGNGTDSIYKYSQIKVTSVPSATISNDVTINFGDSSHLDAGGGATYNWFVPGVDSSQWGLSATDIPNVVASPAYTTTYYCLIGDGSGCYTIRQVVVKIIRTSRIYVPNAFSPNGEGDSRNNVFRINGNNIFSARLTVFDRWGEKIFESEDQAKGWDGTYNGEPLQVGVYTYTAVVIYDLKEGETVAKTETMTGTIALIR